ncbi:plasmid partitioning protein RepB C-terminal domain-containing protein [Acidicapsa dinghuensis]|uniref:Plasmid partitioning protein RepB C-terminal domain-containing protein n=1 Tax=Acidicapsa dinghuensis TaxID=2218256 RepID=A0ABW1ECF9_9BACT|nr:plasmid partitioning protein RepB C-terminal domain-containing protein [Acidicapsa dinghuensis]
MPLIKASFERSVVQLSIASIIPQRQIPYDQRRVLFYKQIEASIREVGMIEPLVVYPQNANQFLLLDGHLRLDVLKRKGISVAKCIIATDDEAYTYNRRVNIIPPVAQHLMLQKALENGLSEERIAAALHVDVQAIKRKRTMLDGVCAEAVKLLETKMVSARAIGYLKKMKPLRQIEAAEHMIASSVYSASFVHAILLATKSDLLANPSQRQNSASSTIRNSFVLENENLVKDLKRLKANLGKEALVSAVCLGYVRRLIGNPKVRRYLDRKHSDILRVFEDNILKRYETDKQGASFISPGNQ